MPVYVLLLFVIGGPGEPPLLKGTLLDKGEAVIFHTLEDCKIAGQTLAQLAGPRFGLACKQVGFDV